MKPFPILDYMICLFELINQHVFKWIFKNDPLHISCHHPFENDYLSKF